MNPSSPIGVFDSGVGGLTVAREIFRNLPNEKIVYYGDTARVPYGNKSAETVIRYSRQICRFLISKDVKAIVVACNTASALALDTICHEFDVPMLGVVEPGAVAAVKATKTGSIGVIGTSSTVSSGLYDKCIRALNPYAGIFSKACPLFVNLVEEGMIDDPVTVTMIHRYLDNMLKKDNIDTLILGCTHYPLLRKVIGREIGSDITLVNPAYETAQALIKLLDENGIAGSGPAAAFDEHEFYVSDATEKFREFAKDNLGFDITNTKLEVLEQHTG